MSNLTEIPATLATSLNHPLALSPPSQHTFHRTLSPTPKPNPSNRTLVQKSKLTEFPIS